MSHPFRQFEHIQRLDTLAPDAGHLDSPDRVLGVAFVEILFEHTFHEEAEAASIDRTPFGIKKYKPLGIFTRGDRLEFVEGVP